MAQKEGCETPDLLVGGSVPHLAPFQMFAFSLHSNDNLLACLAALSVASQFRIARSADART